MHPDDPVGLRRRADARFRALDDLGPDRTADVLDLSGPGTLAPDTDTAHLVVLGKLCAQRLHAMAGGGAAYDRDSAFILTSTVDLVVRELTASRPGDPADLARLNDAWAQLQELRMALERLYTGGEV